MLSKSLFVLAAVALAVNAQSSSTGSAPTIPSAGAAPSTCVISCVDPAARLNNCTGYADIPCVCTSYQFQIDAAACLQEHCPNEYQAALTLQGTVCTGYTVSTPTASPTPRTGIYSSYPASSTGTAPYSSGSSGSAKPTSSPSPTASTSTGTTFEAGVGAFFGAIFAAVAAAAL